ncbi:hypothetical protein A5745_16830 [Mycobacterium sp. IS-2888]|uniref:hypothetical protein n=1 Tax=Mycobacterium sp. IS-2888 TaxID=1834159 RepID=UPI00097AB53E|nr:hypothetical protein [Mycobacterium sp. IS-2888]OMC44100.1 hypothetical protein A5745_16830 [Mycobacterium sp. IS-2888]
MTDYAAVQRLATSRHAHHEAGHAVAAVARGQKLLQVFLGDFDNDPSGATVHESDLLTQPFITFAGPWAEAMWMVENDDHVDDISEALEYAWSENTEGDADKYHAIVNMLEIAAACFGLGRIGPTWEIDWHDELTELWPVIKDVAALLIKRAEVTHEIVENLLQGTNRNPTRKDKIHFEY